MLPECRSKLHDDEASNFVDAKSPSDWFKTSRSSIKNPIQDSRFKRRNQEATRQDFI